jgi:hypothetical protein
VNIDPVSNPQPPSPWLPKLEEDPAANQGTVPWLLRLLFILSLLILLMSAWAETVRLNGMARTQPAGVGADDHLVLPGERVGFITVNLPIDQVEARLGRGRIRPTEHAVLYFFANMGLTCGVENGRVTSILINTPAFLTRTGLCVGSDVEKVIRTYGDGYEYDQSSAGRSPARKVPTITPTALASALPVQPFNTPTPLARELRSSEAESETPRPAAPQVTPIATAPENRYTLHYWEKGIHFNVRGTRVDSILIASPVGNS